MRAYFLTQLVRRSGTRVSRCLRPAHGDTAGLGHQVATRSPKMAFLGAEVGRERGAGGARLVPHEGCTAALWRAGTA